MNGVKKESGFGADAFDGIRVSGGGGVNGAMMEEVTRRRVVLPGGGGGVGVSFSGEDYEKRRKESDERRKADIDRLRGLAEGRRNQERERRARVEKSGGDWRVRGFGKDGAFNRVYVDAGEFYEGVQKYFERMKGEIIEVPCGKELISIPMPVTVEGLCVDMGITVRDFVENYGRGIGYEDFWCVVEFAKNYISEFLIREGLVKRYNSNLLWSLLKQHSEYFDKKGREIDSSGGGGWPIGGSPGGVSGGAITDGDVRKEYRINLIPGTVEMRNDIDVDPDAVVAENGKVENEQK